MSTSRVEAVLNWINPLAPYKNIWAVGKRYLWTVPIVAVGGLVASTLEGVGISLLIPLLSTLMPGAEPPADAPGAEGVMAFLEWLPAQIDESIRLPAIAAVILFFVIIKSIVTSLNSLFIGWVDGLASHDVRRGLARRLTEVGYPFYLKNDPAELLTILSSQSWSATDAIRTVFSMVADVAAIIVFATLLFLVDWRMSLVVAVLSVLISVTNNIFRNKVRELGERVSEANHLLGHRMLVVVEAFRMIKIFGQELPEQKRFNHASESVRKTSLDAESFGAWIGPILETVHATIFIGIMLVAFYSGMSGPVLLTFLVLLYRLQPYIQSIDSGRLSLAESHAALDEVEWLLDPADKPPPPSGSVVFRDLTGPIVLEDVTFRYPTRPDAPPALANVNVTFKPGKATALLGRSGSGKTTLVNLLCRLLQPTEGRVLVAGVDLNQVEPSSWRAHLGFAGQDVDLVEGTIADNIAYGMQDATRAQIEAAAKLADIHDFIVQMPEGYDTDAGTRGLSLSGGQRQRVGLARALVRNPTILVFDEATNAVDGISEAAILNVVKERGLTAIVVSHRMSTLSFCDEGVVLEDGRVIEAGPLKELPSYHRLATLMPA